MDEISRREFLENAGKAAIVAGLGTAAVRTIASEPTAKPKRVGANDKLIMGVIGCGGMGRGDMSYLKDTGEVEYAMCCDPYQPHLDEAIKISDGKAKGVKDFREVLDNKDIDAVIVATPDHWHCIIGAAACVAGKDVYCEKPLSIDISQGRGFVNAARKYNRVVQTGTQQRSGSHFQEAVRLVQMGKIGKVTSVNVWIVGNAMPNGIGSPPDEPAPANLDWEMWQGPAKRRPYNRNRCIYNFRWFWDYSGGKMTDWGVHLIDIVQWAMQVDYPLAVSASGGKLGIRDNRETADTQIAVYEYPGFVMNWSHQDCNGFGRDGHGYGIQFHGDKGTLFVDRGSYTLLPEGDRAEKVSGGGSQQNEPHVRNFLACVKSREKPVSDVEICHRSTSACHLSNISLWTGRKIKWDGANEKIVGDSEASKHLKRPTTKPWAMPKV